MKPLKTDILILGAGIGGYETFRSLARRLKRAGLRKKITIVDQNNYFTFVPMLHEAAAGSIEPHHCAIPLRELTAGTPHEFLKARLEKIIPEKKRAITNMGEIAYDYCVVALGSGVNYFGVPGADKYTHHVRSLMGAMRLHHDFIELLEHTHKKNIALTVVGGGYTGVEVAGQFSDFVRKDLKKLYPDTTVSVSLIETGGLVLKYMPERVRRHVTQRLKKMGVRLLLKTKVNRVEKDRLIISRGAPIQSDITIWTTGFRNLAENFLKSECTTNCRVPVTNSLTFTKDSSLYAVGDTMYLLSPDSDIPYPQLAEAAHKEGQYVARHLVRRLQGKKTRPFTFKPKGTLMPVGDWWGVMALLGGKIILFGPVAWWIRRTVYLFFMPGLIRKIKIAFDWTLHGLGFRYILTLLDFEQFTRERD